MDLRARAKSISFEAVIVRADGTREPLGIVAYWHKNPLRRWAWNIKQALRGKRGKVTF